MKKHKTTILLQISSLLLTILIIGTLAGCSDQKAPMEQYNRHPLAGEYLGVSGSYLKINQDGTCIYGEPDDTGSARGTWRIEDNLLYIEAENLQYVVNGDISNADEGILLEGPGAWTDEYFIRQD